MVQGPFASCHVTRYRAYAKRTNFNGTKGGRGIVFLNTFRHIQRLPLCRGMS